MNLERLTEVLHALPSDLQGKAREGDRLLDLRRSGDATSLRLTLNLRDNNGSDLIFDALLQIPTPPAPSDAKAAQLQSLSPGGSFNKRAQRCMQPMLTWAIQLLSQTPEKIQRNIGRKPQWLAPVQKLVTTISRDSDWTQQWLLRHEIQLEDLRKKQRLNWVLRELVDEGHIARADWRDDESVVDAAAELLARHYPQVDADAILSELEDTEFEDAEEAIAAVNIALAPLELKLYVIESDDDSYLLSLQDAASAEQLRQTLLALSLNLLEPDA
jgi:hypothetical protein